MIEVIENVPENEETGESDEEGGKNEWLDRIINFLATYLP